MTARRISRDCQKRNLTPWILARPAGMVLAACGLIGTIGVTASTWADTPQQFNPSSKTLKPLTEDSNGNWQGGFQRLREQRRRLKKSPSSARAPGFEARTDSQEALQLDAPSAIHQALFENEPRELGARPLPELHGSKQLDRRRRVFAAFGIAARPPREIPELSGSPLELDVAESESAPEQDANTSDSETTESRPAKELETAELVPAENQPTLQQPPALLQQFATDTELPSLPQSEMPLPSVRSGSQPAQAPKATPTKHSLHGDSEASDATTKDFAFVMSLSDEGDSEPSAAPTQHARPTARPEKVSVFGNNRTQALAASAEIPSHSQQHDPAATDIPSSKSQIDITVESSPEGNHVSLNAPEQKPANDKVLSHGLPRPKVVPVLLHSDDTSWQQNIAMNDGTPPKDNPSSANSESSLIGKPDLESPVSPTVSEEVPASDEELATAEQLLSDEQPASNEQLATDQEPSETITEDRDMQFVVDPELEQSEAIARNSTSTPDVDNESIAAATLGNPTPLHITRTRPEVVAIDPPTRAQHGEGRPQHVMIEDDGGEENVFEHESPAADTVAITEIPADPDLNMSEGSPFSESFSDDPMGNELTDEIPSEVADMAPAATEPVSPPEPRVSKPLVASPTPVKPPERSGSSRQVAKIEKPAPTPPSDRKTEHNPSEAPARMLDSELTITTQQKNAKDPEVSKAAPSEPLANNEAEQTNDEPEENNNEAKETSNEAKETSNEAKETSNDVAQQPVRPTITPTREPVLPVKTDEPAVATKPAKPSPEDLSLVTHRKVDMLLRQTSAVRTNFEIERAAVVDADVCDVVQFAPDEAVVIAKGAGTTHVRLWFKGSEDSTNYLVTVTSAEEAAQHTNEEYEKLRKTIRQMYPKANVNLIPSGDRLIVKGMASSDEEAIQILTLVRRVRLIPVVDQLVVERPAVERRVVRR